jgi:cytochrome c553
MLQRSLLLSLTLPLLGATSGAAAADVEAGRAKVEHSCSKCHETADWKGKSEAQLQSMIEAVADGKAKHKKKLNLTSEDIANIAAYWAAAANK